MTPTPYNDLNTVLDDLVQSVQAILQDNFVGIYLQGSFAIGDFDAYSDVDFIVIVAHALSESHIAALQTMHERIYERHEIWAKHLEGSYFPKATIRQYTDCTEQLWYLNNGSHECVLSTHCNTVLVRWIVRNQSITLAGAAPKELIDDIPVRILRQYIWEDMHQWGADILAEPERFANVFYQQFILQSYCRMLHDFVRGYPGSKRAGTKWAKATFAPTWHSLIDRSWAERGNGSVTSRQPADPESFQSTLDFVRLVLRASERYHHLIDS